jgi:hypothetical protein
MKRVLLTLLLLSLGALVPRVALAKDRGSKPTEVVGLPTPRDLLIGRFPRHIPEYVPDRAGTPPPAGTYEALAWRVRFGGGEDDPAAYMTLASWHLAHGEDELAWWAAKRALELGGGGPLTRATHTEKIAGIEAAWKKAGRKDPPTDEQFRFVRGGADRWVQAFQIAERQAFSDKEHLADEAVQRRIGEQADMQVPPAILGAESFMRRWGVGLLIAAVALVFWSLYLVAVLRKRRRLPATGA